VENAAQQSRQKKKRNDSLPRLPRGVKFGECRDRTAAATASERERRIVSSVGRGEGRADKGIAGGRGAGGRFGVFCGRVSPGGRAAEGGGVFGFAEAAMDDNSI